MNLSEEAIAAAQAAIREALHENHPLWDIARLAVEAAAPYIQADAWDQGHGAGWNDCLLDMENGGARASRNPYRGDAA